MLTLDQNHTPVKSNEGTYHHGNLRVALIGLGFSTLELQTSKDAKLLNLRDLAKKLGVSATAVYRHFPNKEALMVAIAAEGFRRFSAEHIKAFKQEDVPFKALHAAGCAYVKFAQKHSVLFRLMFSSFAEMRKDPEVYEASLQTYKTLCEWVAQILDIDDLNDPRVSIAVLQAWGLTHGISMLIIDNMLDTIVLDIDEAVSSALGKSIFNI